MEQFVKQLKETHEHVYNYFGETTKRTMQLAAKWHYSGYPGHPVF